MRLVFIIGLLASLLLLAGCAVNDFGVLKSDDYVGDTVLVRGVVVESVKIGDFSGFVLEDKYGETIRVSSDVLPVEGEKETVRGTLMKDALFGYYIKS